jgi:hypothetical protein
MKEMRVASFMNVALMAMAPGSAAAAEDGPVIKGLRGLGRPEEMSHESASFLFDINSLHYTPCLLNVRDYTQQLPAFGAANPTVLRDDKDNQYNIAIFSNVMGKLANGEPISEMCYSFLADNKGTLGEALPDVKWLQASKCYGIRVAGYDYLPHSAIITPITSMKANAVGIRVHLNSSFVFSQTPVTTTFATKTLENLMLDTFHTHHAGSDIEASPYYGYIMRVYNHHPTTIELKPVSVALGDAFNGLFDSNLDASDLHTCLSFEVLAAPTDYSMSSTVAAHFNQHLSPSEFYDSLNTDKLRNALMMDAQPLRKVNSKIRFMMLSSITSILLVRQALSFLLCQSFVG